MTSDMIYTILSPMDEFHSESLYLETQLGTFVPEPGANAMWVGMSLLLTGRGCRRR
jgi:hypothetical protein